jgi:hypothetical protein
MIVFQGNCRDCHNRAVGCHSTCESYIAAKEQHKKKIDESMKHRFYEFDADEVKKKAVIATRKKRNRR